MGCSRQAPLGRSLSGTDWVDVVTRIEREPPSTKRWNVCVATKGQEPVATPSRRYWITDEWQLSGTVDGELSGRVGSDAE